MFTNDNTEGFTAAQLETELNGLEPYTTEYYEEEKRASHIILKKWGGA